MPRWRLAIPVVVLGLVALTPQAFATVDRADYVTQAETVCQDDLQTQPHPPLAAYIPPSQVKQLDDRLLVVIGKSLGVVNKWQKKVTADLAQIPPAPGDESVVDAWLIAQTHAHQYADRLARAARRKQRKKFASLERHQGTVLQELDSATSAFGSPSPFHYCGLV